MVCRENKARSTVMGFMKHLMKNQTGGRIEHDRLYQSTLHKTGHDYSAAPDPSPQEYMAFLQGVRQQIVDDRTISENDKYRQSHRQPGMVTRIDQEIERVRTGKDEQGRPLRSDQRNGGKHFAAMQRMQPAIERATVARDGYLDTYARHTGVSVKEARDEYDSLVSRGIDPTKKDKNSEEPPRPDLRQNPNISLTDKWQDSLTVAGMTSKQQADIMQDNASRDALQIMEQRRLAKVRSLPSRPAIRAEHNVPVISSEQAKGYVKCDECGQFGHEGSACPNAKELDTLHKTFGARADARAELDRVQAEVPTAQLRARLNDEPMPEATPEQVEAIKAAESRVKRADRAYDKAKEAFETKRGPVPHVSDAVEALAYNRESGLLEVTRKGYTMKDGTERPPKTYRYRMSNEEFDEIMASDSIGHGLGVTTGGKGDINARYAYENKQDADEATRERRCPSCGQWATMNSSHQCPVTEGSRASTEEAHYRERQRAARERQVKEGLPIIANAARAGRQRDVFRSTNTPLADGTQVRHGYPGDVIAARNQGLIARAPVVAQNQGYQVSGRSYSWKDPHSGTPYTTFSDMKCTCGKRGTCEHIERVGNATSVSYRSQRALNAQPGQAVLRKTDDGTTKEATVAKDAPPTGGISRVNYGRIQERRAEQRTRLNAQWARGRNEAAGGINPSARPIASMPTTNAYGASMSTPAPSGYSDAETRTVYDMRTTNPAAAGRMEQNLAARSDRSWVVRNNGDGTQTITAPSERLERDGSLSASDQSALGSLLGSSRGGMRHGAYIPADAAWRSEFMDRSAGREPQVRGGRFVATSERTMYNPDQAHEPRV